MSPQLAQLDFRRKSSWTEALQWLEAAPGCFEQWLAQPPEEYSALFAEINEAVGDLQAGIRRGFELSGELLQSAESLEREAAEVLEEAQELRRQAELHREQRARDPLN